MRMARFCRSWLLVIGVINCFFPVFGQSYQSGFSEVKFDRAKAPGSLHGAVEVDAPTGALNISVPLGPGIGARGVSYQPVLRGRVAPVTELRSANRLSKRTDFSSFFGTPYFTERDGYPEASPWLTWCQGFKWEGRGQKFFTLDPGHVETFAGLPAQGAAGAGLGAILLPSGRRSSFSIRPEKGMLPGVDPLAVVRQFPGYGSGWQLSPLPAVGSNFLSSGGELVVGLVSAANPLVQLPLLTNFNLQNLASGQLGYGNVESAPSRLLVIIGETAFEFSFCAARLVPYVNWKDDYDPLLAQLFPGTGPNSPVADTPVRLRYRITGILNRQGDRIDFQYDPPSTPLDSNNSNHFTPPFRASWTPAGTGVKATIQMSFTGCSYTADGADAAPGYAFVGVQGTQSIPQVPGAEISIAMPGGSGRGAYSTGPWGDWDAFSISEVIEAGSNARVKFVVGAGPGVAPNTVPGAYNNGAPTASEVITSIQMPGRDYYFSWSSYPFRRNSLDAEAWQGYRGDWAFTPDNCYGRPEDLLRITLPRTTSLVVGSSVCGVTRVEETAPGVETRVTEHNRVLPVPQPNTATAWSSTTFYDAIRHPDGQIEVLRFLEPPISAGQAIGSPSASLSEQYQTLGFLKHLVKEVRHYPGGANWQYEASNGFPYGNTQAYAIEVNDRFDVRNLGVNGGLESFSVPYPTRTRKWSFDSGAVTQIERLDWDASAYEWRTERLGLRLGTPQDLGTFEMLGCAVPSAGCSQSSALSGATRNQTVTTLFENHPESYRFALPNSRSVQLTDSSSGGYPPPNQNWVYEEPLPGVFRIKSESQIPQDGSATRTLAYTEYTSNSGLGVTLPKVLTLQMTGSRLSGAVGVEELKYDSCGFLASIQPKGGFPVSQVQDSLGRVKSQTDANNFTSAFTRDALGRLTNIAPPGGEFTSQICYNDDNLGWDFYRGEQHSKLRFNGFGEPIREVRYSGSNSSSRSFGFQAGRKVWETVWEAGEGLDGGWANNATSFDTVQVVSICEQWAPARRGQPPICLVWDTQTVGVYSPRIRRYEYDGRGRVARIISPNGEVEDFQYGSRRTTRTRYTAGVVAIGDAPTGALSTVFETDLLGRLIQITDAQGNMTTYSYDLSDRRVGVRQTDSVTNLSQSRSWSYDGFGRLLSTTHPETGTISYADYDVNGKAWVENKNGRIINRTYDPIGRILSVGSPDGSVDQEYRYDAPSWGSVKGRLVISRDKDITIHHGYSGRGGRLSDFNTLVGGQWFNQSFSYDAYGHRESASIDGRTISTGFDNSKDLPNVATYQGGMVATAGWDATTWNLSNLNWNISGVASFYGYGADQTRLSGQTHTWNGGRKDWSYGYDGLGRLTSNGEDTYFYDELSRLSGATTLRPNASGSLTQSFGYDAFGNLLNSSPSGAVAGVTGFGVNRWEQTVYASNRLPASQGCWYDAQGNISSVSLASGGATRSFEYDSLGRVSRVAGSGILDERYAYTANSVQAYIEEGPAGSPVVRRVNLYDDSRRLVAQYSSIGNGAFAWKRDVLYLGGKEIAEFGNDGLKVTQTDHLGSPRFLLNTTGTLIAEQKYTPFGESLVDNATAQKFAKGFTGHVQTSASGIIDMQYRKMLPTWGRFTSPDPGWDQNPEDPQSWNLNSYVRNNPVMMTDPTGMVAGDVESVGQLLDRKGLEAAVRGDRLAQAGWATVSAFYSVLTPGGDRLSEVNARAQNGEIVPVKDLAVAGGIALGQVALTALPGVSQGRGVAAAGAGETGQAVVNGAKASSRALGTAMEAAGQARPVGSAAHHIVAGNAKAAAPARAVLAKFGIGINEASNGVFLPKVANSTGAAVHAGGHTNAYYNLVNQALSQATTREAALEALAAVRKGLQNGAIRVGR